jgi:hypothetical protein
MRKSVLIIFIFLTLVNFSCKSKKQNFYHGFVYNINDKKPIKNVLVKENFKENFLTEKTDSLGYFKIINNTGSIGELIFICDNFKTDTIPTIWSQHGEKLKYLFLNKIPDTIFLTPVK